MSSHHFVKENQEPALIIANGLACEEAILGQLLEWSPYVVVLDGALDRVLSLGIKFDLLLGDFDRIDLETFHFNEQADVMIMHTPDQDKTDLEKALDFLIDRNQLAVNIVWATGLRMDHTFNNIITIAKYADKINCVVMDDKSRIFILPKSFQKYYDKHQIISLFPICAAHGIRTKGLLYNLDNESLSLPNRTGSSNETVETGLVEITYDDGILVLMECTD